MKNLLSLLKEKFSISKKFTKRVCCSTCKKVYYVCDCFNAGINRYKIENGYYICKNDCRIQLDCNCNTGFYYSPLRPITPPIIICSNCGWGYEKDKSCTTPKCQDK